jgi:methionyl-tRNA formyltransferase
MKVLFWGSPGFALPSLRALEGEGHDVVGVVTQPDRPAGRGRTLRTSAVKEVALAEGYPVLTPEKPKGPDFLDQVRELAPDISVVAAYGQILRPEVLELPPLGSINVHASLLPELRGAAPVNWAIARGFSASGVTIMRMVEALDAGPILFQAEEPIGPKETATELAARLAELGAEALIETLALFEGGMVEEVDQDDALATYAPKVDREAARIDWEANAESVGYLIRGMDAVPGAWSELGGLAVKLFRPTPDPTHEHGEWPGTVLTADSREGLLVAAGVGAVRIDEVQPAGKRRMEAQEWIVGRGVVSEQRFR